MIDEIDAQKLKDAVESQYVCTAIFAERFLMTAAASADASDSRLEQLVVSQQQHSCAIALVAI